MRNDLAKRLHDARTSCLKIDAVTQDIGFAEYVDSEVVRLAVERLLEIVGEALSVALRIDPTLEDRYPDLRRAVSLRNRIIHGYDDINDTVIWDIVQTNVPPLARDLGILLDEAPVIETPP